VIQPLRELLDVPRAQSSTCSTSRQAKWSGCAAAGAPHRDRPGVRYSLELMGDVEALRRGEPQVIDTLTLPPGPKSTRCSAPAVNVYMAIPMIAGGELIGAVSFGGELRDFPASRSTSPAKWPPSSPSRSPRPASSSASKQYSEELELRVHLRTQSLEVANKELEAFSYSVSHDLRAPLRAVDGYARMLEEDYGGKLDAEAIRLLGAVRANSHAWGKLIDDLLAFSRLGRAPIRTQPVEMTPLVAAGRRRAASDVTTAARSNSSVGALGSVGRRSRALQAASDEPREQRDQVHARQRSRRRRDRPARARTRGDAAVYFREGQRRRVRHEILGQAVRRVPAAAQHAEVPGPASGSPSCKRVINRHGGKVWATRSPAKALTFYFTLQRE
jgi:hypothetical protein